MKLSHTPVMLFCLAAGAPFVVSVAFFVISQRRSLLMEPETYITTLKQTGGASHRISLGTWKSFLAHDSLCRGAAAVIIGSSREGQIDATVVGSSTCNLFIDGLSAPGFAHLAQDLFPLAPGQHCIVYVGLDHFWLWADTDPFDSVELTLLSRARPLWRVWAISKALAFFTIDDLREALRRPRQESVRFEDRRVVWYPDGHVSYPQYYAQKHAGIHESISQQDIEDGVNLLFAKGQVHESNLRALEIGIRLLHTKGYEVWMFWNPVSPAHIAAARHHFPVLFQQTIDAIDRLAVTLPLDRYFPASQMLDASRFGCTKDDDQDAVHVDIDCLRRVFTGAFRLAYQ